MEIIRGLHNITPNHHGNVGTMGNFDGVHKGHQMLLGHLGEKSEEHGVPSMVVTFEPQPREFFAGASVPPRLTRLREKAELLRRNGLERLLLLPFNEKTARTPAKWIVEELFSRILGAKYVVVGDDFDAESQQESLDLADLAGIARRQDDSVRAPLHVVAASIASFCAATISTMPARARDSIAVSSSSVNA